MARLVSQVDWPDYDEYDSYEDYREAEQERWKEVKEGSEDIEPDDDCIIGAILRFPRADGYAFYRVEAQDPLSLSHIPYGDAWHLPKAHLRGLREEDVRDAFTFGKSLASVMSDD